MGGATGSQIDYVFGMLLSWTASQKKSFLFASTLFTLTGMWTQGCGDGANAVDIETSAKDGGRPYSVPFFRRGFPLR